MYNDLGIREDGFGGIVAGGGEFSVVLAAVLLIVAQRLEHSAAGLVAGLHPFHFHSVVLKKGENLCSVLTYSLFKSFDIV